MNKLLLLTLSTLCAICQADQYYHAENVFPATKTEPFNPWIFEFKNKTPQLLFLEVINGDTLYTIENSNLGVAPVSASRGSKESQHGYFRIADPRFSPRMRTILRIWNTDKNRKINKAPYREYVLSENGNRKQIFLTFEQNKLMPQKGKKGKTQSGISIRSNIVANDIKSPLTIPYMPEIPQELANYFIQSEKNKNEYAQRALELELLRQTPAPKPTYYQILGIPIDASEQYLNIAYRARLAKAKTDTEKTVLKSAYETLQDPKKREAYNKKINKTGEHNY